MHTSVRKIALQSGIALATFALAAGLQTFAFSEPSGTPPSNDAYAPLNTGPIAQDKRDVTDAHGAWVTADGVGSRYSSLFATLGGSVGVGTTSPQARLDVNGDVKIGDTAATCSALIAGDLRYHSGTVQLCDGTSWQSVTLGTSCSSVPNGTLSGSDCSTLTCNSGAHSSGGSCVSDSPLTISGSGLGTFASAPSSVSGTAHFVITSSTLTTQGYHNYPNVSGSITFYNALDSVISSVSIASCAGEWQTNDLAGCTTHSYPNSFDVPPHAAYIKAYLTVTSGGCSDSFGDCQPSNNNSSFTLSFTTS